MAEFTVRDGVAWLGIAWDDYVKACEATEGRHGGPVHEAVLAARAAQGTEATAQDILDYLGIDPADPVKAQREWAKGRSRYDDTSKEFEQ